MIIFVKSLKKQCRKIVNCKITINIKTKQYKKMGKKQDNFKETLNGIQEILVAKKQFQNLASRSGVSLRTVYSTFDVESFEELKGKQLAVYQEAIVLVEEINNLPQRAENAINK